MTDDDDDGTDDGTDGQRTDDDDGTDDGTDGRTTTTTTTGHDDDDDGKMSKNIFKPCSHIEFNTTNPNTIFKITICFTKYPKSQNTFEILKSKSTVYPPKQTRTDVSGHRSGAEFRCASFIQICFFF